MKKFGTTIFLTGIKLPIENKTIEAKNMTSALIVTAGEIATNEKYKGCKSVSIIELSEFPCNFCQGGGCFDCKGYGYVLLSKE